jgi:hypothetical protein
LTSADLVGYTSIVASYPRNAFCHKWFNAAVGQRVTLSFSAFETESNFDSVSIFDGDSTSAPQLAEFSGADMPPAVKSTGPALLVFFESDSVVQKAGWKPGLLTLGGQGRGRAAPLARRFLATSH